jgi:beta-N-acetylhexosaminidase
MRYFLIVFLCFSAGISLGQQNNSAVAKKWADSVYNTLSNDERIGQLVVARLSTIDMKTKKITFLNDSVAAYVKRYNIGGVCLFQGSPQLQAGMVNNLKRIAKTPILFSIDGEWGVGMRIFDSVLPLPRQMMLGAMSDSSIVYQYGKVVADQCKRLGIQMNYAPDVDVNNNPNNPVINDRSFGEDKYKVASFGIQYMKGMQDNGVMACAKHFPGHGDVAVDSHLDLPVINKTMAQLDSTELYPFKKIFEQGVSCVMNAHLFIPAIDTNMNRPTSLSKKNIEGLLRKDMGYQGLAITDGLEMQGVRKFFPNGAASVESIIAGNDLLCIPDSIPLVISKIKSAIDSQRLTWAVIEEHCKKVLMAKYKYVLPSNDSVSYNNLTADLNKSVLAMRELVAKNAITLLAKEDQEFFPLKKDEHKVVYVSVGINTANAMARRLQKDYNADVINFDFSKKNVDSVNMLIDSIAKNYQRVIIGIHQINRAPANNFGISADAVSFINFLQQRTKAITILFGNAYAAKNWCFAKNLVVAYEDDSTVQYNAIDMLQGKSPYKGTLPVSVCENLKFGYGLTAMNNILPITNPEDLGFDKNKLNSIDSIVADGITKKAIPGCVVLVAKDGKLIFEKGYGYYTYEHNEPVTKSSVYDLASVTKILATTLGVMKMYDEGKIDLKKKLSDYLPSVIGTDKANISIEQLLLHEGGLKSFIPFYKETLDSNQMPSKKYYQSFNKDCFDSKVANGLNIRCDAVDTFYKRILESPRTNEGAYVYSDNDFIFLGKIIEQISGLPLNDYVKKNFYGPMSLASMGYKPLDKISYSRIVPSTKEIGFRNQELRGYVHDQGAAIMGGVAGHAGLFADAYDMACVMQMLLNGGEWNGRQMIKKQTIELFTDYHSALSRRGYGFDKPEIDNATRAEAYPAKSASAKTFGHTGFTGTCVWADPESKLIFVFLSNRIYPEDNGVFKTLNMRHKILETIYQSILN